MDERGVVTQRNRALDFSKGVLVLFMVLYHWINYFVGLHGPIYTYLRFIPPSFVFITGFLIANVYPARYGLRSVQVYRRMLVRGGKLLLLFVVLNVAANLVFTRSYKGTMPGVDGFFSDLAIILMTGNVKAAFMVLVPISYLLFMAAAIFLVGRAQSWAIPVVCTVLFLGIVALDVDGAASPNLTILGIGILGMSAGLYPLKKTEILINRPVTVLSLNVVYLLVISICGTTYPLQVLGVILSLALIYLAGMKSSKVYGLSDLMILLGQYSLFAYVAQIALLQSLQRLLPYLSLHSLALRIISFIGAFAFTILAVILVHWFRKNSPIGDKLYKVIFS